MYGRRLATATHNDGARSLVAAHIERVSIRKFHWRPLFTVMRGRRHSKIYVKKSIQIVITPPNMDICQIKNK